MLASDSSIKLIELVTQRGFDGITANLLSLPYRKGILDFFICIAVLHHLATPERRVEGIKAMVDLLRVGGEGLIQVWAKDQKWTGQAAAYVEKSAKSANEAPPAETTVVPGGLAMPVQKPRTPFVASDVLLPWKAKNKNKNKPTTTPKEDENIVRYYHVFEARELEELIAHIPCIELIECVYEQGNWSAIIRKISE